MLRTGFLPPFLFCVWATSGGRASTSASASGVDADEQIEPSRAGGSDLGTTGSMTSSFWVELAASTVETIGTTAAAEEGDMGVTNDRPVTTQGLDPATKQSRGNSPGNSID